jgi:hypothetical protein
MNLNRILSLALVSGIAGVASASVIWDESVNGDMSNNRFVPSDANLSFGVNSLLATTGGGDVDYIHFHLSPGMALSSILFISWTGNDTRGFLGVQAGTTFTEPPTGTNVANLLGWTHFGPGVDTVGQDILPLLGAGAGSIGFTGPLTGSDYTFWLNQTNATPQSYRLDFVATPEPSSFLALLGVPLVLRRRRR